MAVRARYRLWIAGILAVVAIMLAAKACDAPVIMQASRGARAYAGDIMLAKMIDALTEMYPEIPILPWMIFSGVMATPPNRKVSFPISFSVSLGIPPPVCVPGLNI